MAPAVLAKKQRDFDPKKFLATIGEGRKVVAFPSKQTIFTQGEAADAVFYIQQGKVRLTVVSKLGTLTVHGERKIEKEEKEENFRRVERQYGEFTRSFTLPSSVDTGQVSAHYDKAC